ncbi:multicilin [Excalfactoria chinensis]|uniref:multicilin n=1 Tax=Excalfactoria chinensis TaxID=46218 RepID=UPI003B3A71BB
MTWVGRVLKDREVPTPQIRQKGSSVPVVRRSAESPDTARSLIAQPDAFPQPAAPTGPASAVRIPGRRGAMRGSGRDLYAAVPPRPASPVPAAPRARAPRKRARGWRDGPAPRWREASGRASRGLAPAPAPRTPAASPRDGAERGEERRRRPGRRRRGGMEQGGRRAFGSICPNRAAGPPARGAKKPARTGGAAAGTPQEGLSPRGPAGPGPALSHRRLSPPRAHTVRDWQELAARGPVLPAAAVCPAAPSQGQCLQHEPEFDFQDLRDAVDDFISDASTWAPPPPDCAEFDFSLVEDVAFDTRAVCPQPPETLQTCWRDAAERHRQALGDALEENSQLQEALAQKQEELAMQRESNVQLKELASQARQLAAVLDKLMLPQRPDGDALPPPAPPPPAESCGRAEAAGVGGMLRAVSAQCRAALRSLAGSPAAKRPRLHGAFRGLRTAQAAVPRSPGGAELEGGGSLRTAFGEQGGIRTLAFPLGNAYTLRTAGGGYRFLWVPR